MFYLLQRQIFREILYLFCLIVSALLLLIMISRAIQMRELFLGLELGIVDTILLFSYMIPLFLMLVIPIACMLSVFLTFLRMSTDKELIALRASGINIYQMLPAPFLFSIICTLITLWISLHWISWGMEHFKSTLLEIVKTRAKISIQPGIFNKSFPGIILFVRQVDPITGELKQILLEDRTRKEQLITILAPNGNIEINSEKDELVFNLSNGKIYTMGKQTSSFLYFDQYLVRLSLDILLKNLDFRETRPKEMSWKELLKAHNGVIQSTIQYKNKISVELHKRWAYPLACLALTLFSLPLATMFEGIHRQLGLILALIMFFIYYSLMSLGFSTGESGTIPPAIGLWVPNILFLSFGLVGLYLTANEKTGRVIYFIQNIWQNIKSAK